MVDAVKPDRRSQRRAATESRLVRAASDLFVERGYAATTLTDVAEQADVAPRTLYLHFATKAELLLRCIGIALAGDAEPVALADRPAMAETMSEPTLDARIRLMASLTATLMERAGPLLDVAFQAAPSEPSIAGAADAGRDATRQAMREFWHRAHGDGLLPRPIDLEWLTETATLLAHAETFLLLEKTAGWSIETYRDWLVVTWRRLATPGTDIRR